MHLNSLSSISGFKTIVGILKTQDAALGWCLLPINEFNFINTRYGKLWFTVKVLYDRCKIVKGGLPVNRLSKIIGCLLFVIAIGYGYVAYFVSSFNPATGISYDGLGRTTTEAAGLIQSIFGKGKLWAGWPWFLLDMVIILGALGTALYLFLKPAKGQTGDETPEYKMSTFETEED